MTDNSGNTRKTLGVTELHWVCPSCHSVNKGTEKVCTSCAAPQPKNVQFIQPAQEALITDKTAIEKAKAAAPDIHCAYCGTRNRADATVCVRCGGNLGEGTAREAGSVLGAHQSEAQPDVTCPSCGKPNPATARKCAYCFAPLPAPRPAAGAVTADRSAQPAKSGGGRIGLYIAVGVVGLVVLLIFLMTRTSEVIGTVQAVEWTRNVAIMGLAPVQRDNWNDQLPAEATDVSCEERVRRTQPQPDPDLRSVEVCGTPYTVDLGTGLGEVVQDCEFQIYEAYCEYSVLDWQVVDTLTLSGADFAPQWPGVGSLASDRREGDRSEQYEVVFRADGQNYTYTTRDAAEFSSVQQYEDWILNVNSFGGVTSIEPRP